MDKLAWEQVDLRDPAARQDLAESILGIEASSSERSLFHDLAWLLEAEGRTFDDVQVYVCRGRSGLRAYAPLVVQPWFMRFRIGELTLFSRKFERLHMNNGPVVMADPAQSHAELVTDLLAKLRPLLTRHQVIYLEGIAVDGEVERATTAESTRKLYKVLEPLPRYARRLIRLPSTFDEYLGTLNSQTRQGLRRQHRKLEKHLAGGLRLVCCSDIDQIGDFVRRAVAISSKTYQWHLLGLGLRKADELEQTLTAMARHGWTRCYLLECAGAATAFMIGYLYAGTYYYVDVGFDPDWEKWSVGTVLHLEVIRDLIEGHDRARSFDFSSGSGVHKKRFSNDSRGEATYLLVPRDARNNALVAAFRGINALSSVTAGLLDRLHLKAAVKRLIRRHATDKALPIDT